MTAPSSERPSVDDEGEELPDSNSRTALFDLDGVLTRRDTFATLVKRRLLAAPWRLALAAPALLPLGLTVRAPEFRAPISRYLVRVALLGLSPEQARTLSRALGREFAATAAWLNLELVERARRHLDHGDRVVVVTATERTLARELLDAVGLADAELLASELGAAPGGTGLRFHNYGRQKLRTLSRRVPQPWSVLYSDSWADQAVMDHVDRVVLVTDSKRLLIRATRKWGSAVVSSTPSNLDRIR